MQANASWITASRAEAHHHGTPLERFRFPDLPELPTSPHILDLAMAVPKRGRVVWTLVMSTQGPQSHHLTNGGDRK